MKTIAERLKVARDWKGWKQVQLAVAADVSTGTIGNIESGARQSKGSLPQIAEALGVNHKWLATGIGQMLDQPPPPPENKPNQPLAGASIASGAIDINVNRRAPPKARDVLADLGALVANADPAVIDGLAGLLASFARAPSNTHLMDSLAGLLEPAAFTQQDQRTG